MKRSKTQWNKVDDLSDSDIDYTEIPELGKDFFNRTEIILPKTKKSITLRLDEEIIDYFKSHGPRYQTKINAVLKTYVRSH